jgi:hypothetical protein
MLRLSFGPEQSWSCELLVEYVTILLDDYALDPAGTLLCKLLLPFLEGVSRKCSRVGIFIRDCIR